MKGAVLLASLVVFLCVAAPSPARAQAVVTDPIVAAQVTMTNIEKFIKYGWVEAAATALYNGVSYFSSQLAYATAVALTSECPGQKPCWNSKSFDQIMDDAPLDAIGEMIGTLSEHDGFSELGLNLCAPTIPGFTLRIQLGLLDEFKPSEPKCKWKAIVENYSQFAASVESGELLRAVSIQFAPGQAPLSTSLRVFDEAAARVAEEVRVQTVQTLADAAAGGGFGGVKDVVSGRIIGPPTMTLHEYNRLERHKGESLDMLGDLGGGQLAAHAVAAVVINSVSIFAQTFASRLWNKFSQGLLSSQELIALQPDIILNAEGLFQPAGRSGATQALTRFLSTPPRDIGLIDPLLDFSICPGGSRMQNNCVVDAQFALAVRAAETVPLTVRGAVERGLLHAGWPLISSLDQPTDQDPFCHTFAYCESNLKKLRARRIIPIGWEIAAAQSSVADPFKLGDVIARFNDCNTAGTRDAAHPFCHLIDPDWVLKMPPVQCRQMAFGPQLVSPEIPTRAETCVDAPSCLKQDDAGNCIGGWGYCARERNVWRFNGEQCPSFYNSCRALTARTGGISNFLVNTIDYGVCSADNVGCRAYSLERNMPASASDPADDWKTLPARFLNRNVEKCEAGADGCTALIALRPGSGLNLVRNGSFEEMEDKDNDGTPDAPRFWSPFGRVPAGAKGEVTPQGAVSGGNAVRLVAGAVSNVCTLSKACSDDLGCACEGADAGFTCRVGRGRTTCSYTNRVMQDGILVRGNFTYTVSFATTAAADVASPIATASLSFFDRDGARVTLQPVNVSTTDPVNCRVVAGDLILFGSPSVQASRAVCTFTINAAIFRTALELRGSGVTVDNVQLEEGGGTNFRNGYGQQTQIIFAKTPPEYLGCTGEPTDAPECAKYAGVCRENEVGCDGFTPTNGDPVVPGIVGPRDSCPAECSGYDAFKQEKSDFESEKFPVFFIPSTARACTEAEAGCSEFTDLTSEQVSYFSKIRSCQSPDAPDSVTFYSWEGSDTTGFELRVWKLKSTAGERPASGAAAIADNSASDIPVTSGATLAGSAPCTKLGPPAGPTELQGCDDSDLEGVCSLDDILAGDFDCREYYDAEGNRHFRRQSKTVSATSECRDYRITVSIEADCRSHNGKWNSVKSECVYALAESEGRACSAASNGCRAYRGNASSNARNIVQDDFETGVDGWQGGVVQSPEAVTVGGHSLKFSSGLATFKEVSPLVAPGRSYSLTFWARGQGTLAIAYKDGATGVAQAAFSDQAAATLAPKVDLTANWRLYSLGPVIVNDPNWGRGNGSVRLEFERQSGRVVFIDNVILKEVQDSIFVVRDSWRTPASCDQTPEGVPSRLEMLGCREYRDTQDRQRFLKSFASLCREQAIGCSAFSDTQGTPENPFSQTFNAVCRLGAVCGAGGVTPDGSSCRCDYDLKHPAASSTAPAVLSDVCRVPVGGRECNFTLDGFDATGGATSHPDRVQVLQDQRRYLAVQGKDLCEERFAGCRETGLPHLAFEESCSLASACSVSSDTFRANAGGCICADSTTGGACTVTQGDSACRIRYENGIVDRWDTVVLKDDPLQYGRTLCGTDAVGCEEFKAADGAYYFKDPGEKVCEYKESVTIGGQERSGWFRQSSSGASFPCYPELLREGDFHDIFKNADSRCTLPNGAVCAVNGGCLCTPPGLAAPVCKAAKGNVRCGYQGWVGACESRYDRCEEFLDPLNTSSVNPKGTPYYYLANAKLDRSSCNGQVGLKQGCTLFNQTSNTQKLFSSPASYAHSAGRPGGGSVSAETCDGAARSEFCKKRCAAKPNGICRGTGTLCRNDGECAGTTPVCVGSTVYGFGCRADADCSAALGEKCVGETASDEADPGMRKFTRNDTNVILKVRPDRECGEWLACQEEEAVFDEQAGKWRSICTGVGTCTKNKESGKTFECANFIEPRPRQLTKEEYSARDVTYRGLEYSGYSLIDRFPLQHLISVKITKGVCKVLATQAEVLENDQLDVQFQRVKLCGATADCDAGQFCGSALTGVCSGKPERSCDPAATTARRGCIASSEGFCNEDVSATTRYAMLLDQNRSCDQDSDCLAARTGAAKNGSCFEHKCVYDFATGGLLELDPRSGSAPACRAFPEADSPFDASVVKEGDDGFVDATGLASAKKSGFKGANVCIEGNVCSCSYERMAYGQGGGVVRFNSASGDEDVLKKFTPGICQGGTLNGQECDERVDCVNPNDEADGGICQFLTNRTVAQGLLGLCVDRDKSVPVNGDPDQFACNLWLPIDRLAGAPDNFNQFREAGFRPDAARLQYCRAAQGNQTAGNYEKTLIVEAQTPLPGLCSSANACAAHDTRSECEGPTNELVDFDNPTLRDAMSSVIPRMRACKWIPDNDQNHDDDDTDGTCVDYISPGPFEGSDACEAYSGSAIAACVGAINTIAAPVTEAALLTGGILPLIVAQFGACMFTVNLICSDSGFTTCNGTELDPMRAIELFRVYSGQPGRRKVNSDVASEGLHKSDLAGIQFTFPDHGGGSFYLEPGRDYINTITWTSGSPSITGVQAGKDSSLCVDLLDETRSEEIERRCRQEEVTTQKQSCIAAKAIFDSEGQLSSITGVTCMHDNGIDGEHIRTAVTALMRENCTDIALVHKDSGFKSLNVAWTDRLHKAATNQAGAGLPSELNGYDFAHQPAVPGGIEYLLPFGPVSPVVKLEQDNPALPIAAHEASGGSPFVIMSTTGLATDLTTGALTEEAIAQAGVGPDPGLDERVVAGYPYSCIGPCAKSQASSKGGQVGLGRLEELFAQAWIGFHWDPTTPFSGYDKDSVAAQTLASWDRREVKIVGQGTGVFKFDPNDCLQEGLCRETGEGLVVNDLQEENITAQGRLKAVIRFYASADKERMPIRRKIIDFGDGGEYEPVGGFFKNHRGTKEVSGEKRPICQPGAANFDEIDGRTCESRYFQVTKTYVCSAAFAEELPTCEGAGSPYPCQRNGACVFKPRVQIMDNWGACNGACKGGTAGVRCMNGDPIDPNAWFSDYGTVPIGVEGNGVEGSPANECFNLQATGLDPDPGRQYLPVTGPNEGQHPWTEYAGEIIITP